MASNKTEGEILFEEYLNKQGIPFEFEKEFPGKRKRPDYAIVWHREILLDVKDFDQPPAAGNRAGAFDPYPRIREKIEQGRKKFKEYKGHPCALVLRNLGHPHVMLESVDVMLGSMYGDSGFTIPINQHTGMGDSTKIKRAFLDRGKMIRPHWSNPHNTSISALITLTRICPDYEPFSRIFQQNKPIEELLRESQAIAHKFKLDHYEPRVIVWHNAFARLPFPEDLFNSPYDIHWGIREGRQALVFRGHLLPADK